MTGLSRSIGPTISFPIQKDHQNLLNFKKNFNSFKSRGNWQKIGFSENTICAKIKE
jgi:hypothetical protein